MEYHENRLPVGDTRAVDDMVARVVERVGSDRQPVDVCELIRTYDRDIDILEGDLTAGGEVRRTLLQLGYGAHLAGQAHLAEYYRAVFDGLVAVAGRDCAYKRKIRRAFHDF